ncbi:MAG: hypothetical protein ACTTIS_00695 [Streptobacillus sp.]
MKLTNKSEGGLTLNNVTAYPLIFNPKSSLVFPNGHLIKDYQKVLNIFKDILDVDLSIEQEEKTKATEQLKKVEEVVETVEDTVEETESTEEGEEEKVAKPKRATKKDK